MPIHNLTHWWEIIWNLTIHWSYNDWYKWFHDHMPDILFYTRVTYEWAFDTVDSLVYWVNVTVRNKLWELEQDLDDLWAKVWGEIVLDVANLESKVTALNKEVYNVIKPKIEELEGNFDAIWADLDALWEALDVQYNAIVEWVNGLFDESYGYINKLYYHIMGQVTVWINDLDKEFRGEISNLWRWVELLLPRTKHLDEFVGSAFDGFTPTEEEMTDGGEPEGQVLAKRTVEKTTKSYAQWALRAVLLLTIGIDFTQEENYAASVNVKGNIDRLDELINLGAGGDWADVLQSLEEDALACDADENPSPRGLDMSLIPPKERAEIESNIKQLDDWIGG